MARVTVEDCVLKVPNRFDLVLLAGQRAREISAGAPLSVDRDNDKNPVVALREIADSTVDRDELRESLVSGLQKHVEVDEPEEDEFSEMEMLASMSVPAEAAFGGSDASDETEEAEADETEDGDQAADEE